METGQICRLSTVQASRCRVPAIKKQMFIMGLTLYRFVMHTGCSGLILIRVQTTL